MMDVKIEKTFVVRMNAEEAGVMLNLFEHVGGLSDSLGRVVTTSMRDALIDAGVMKNERRNNKNHRPDRRQNC